MSVTADLLIEPDAPPPLPRSRSGPGRVVAVLSGKAGTGKSTLVANLAAAMVRQGLTTGVLDLALQFGDQALMLDAPSSPSMIDVLANVDALTPDFVLDCMHHVHGLRLLAAPPSPELADLVELDHLRTIIGYMKVLFDVVVLDTTSYLSDVALEAIDASDRLVVLTTPSLASVKDTKLLLKTLSDLGVAPRKLSAVLNRVEPGLKIATEVLEANIKFPISFELPHAPLPLQESVTDGVPVVISKQSLEFSQKVLAIAGAVTVGEAAPGAKAPRKGLFGLTRG